MVCAVMGGVGAGLDGLRNVQTPRRPTRFVTAKELTLRRHDQPGTDPAHERGGHHSLLFSMKNPLRVLFALFALALLLPLTVSAAAAKKVLVFTKSSGFEHDAIKTDGKPGHGYAFRVLREYGAKHDVEFVESKDGTRFSPEYLAQFDAFVFYTTGDLTVAKSDPRGDGLPPMTSAGKAALLAAVAGGKGFVGIHSAADTFHSFGRNDHVPERFDDDGPNADPYIKMLGGEFIRHGAQQKSRLAVVDPKFAGVAALKDEVTLMEEWYSLKNFAPDLHVLLVQDTAGMKGDEYQRPPYPSTWVRPHGKGRVFYTNLGHREDVWDNPLFQSVLFGGLEWALRRVDADVSPNLAKVAPQANTLPKYVAPPAAAPAKATVK
jgi:type 1 glutamine amidotransferase